jgi:hypothetical protein
MPVGQSGAGWVSHQLRWRECGYFAGAVREVSRVNGDRHLASVWLIGFGLKTGFIDSAGNKGQKST